ncbi:hypothetical protein ACFX1X_028966 [Malus domestica]
MAGLPSLSHSTRTRVCTGPTRTKPFSEDQTFKIGTFAETSQTSSTSTTTMKNVGQYYSFGFSFVIAVVIGAEEGGFF